MNGNGHESPRHVGQARLPDGQAEKRAFAQLRRADEILNTDLDLKQVEKIAAMRGSVYGPLPRRSHGDWTGAIGVVLLVLTGLALWAAFQS